MNDTIVVECACGHSKVVQRAWLNQHPSAMITCNMPLKGDVLCSLKIPAVKVLKLMDSGVNVVEVTHPESQQLKFR